MTLKHCHSLSLLPLPLLSLSLARSCKLARSSHTHRWNNNEKRNAFIKINTHTYPLYWRSAQERDNRKESEDEELCIALISIIKSECHNDNENGSHRVRSQLPANSTWLVVIVCVCALLLLPWWQRTEPAALVLLCCVYELKREQALSDFYSWRMRKRKTKEMKQFHLLAAN